MKRLFCMGLLVVLLLPAARAKVLLDADFRAGSDAGLRQLKIFGDGQARGLNPPGGPLLIGAPTPQSWIYWVKDFYPADLQGIDRLRLTVRAWSNRPEQVQYVISEGASWGEAVDRSERAAGRQMLYWETVTVELERSAPDRLVSFALGLDYYHDGAWVAVDRIVIEGVAGGESFGPPPGDAAPAPYLLPEEAQGWFVSGLDPAQLVWQQADELQPFDAETELSGDDTRTIRLTAPRRVPARTTLLLNNRSDAVLTFQLACEGLPEADVRLQRLLFIEGVPDLPLPLGPEGLFEIGRRQCTGLEVTVDTGGLEPGLHTAVLRLTPLDGRLPEREMTVELEVVPVVLPERMPIAVFNWDYGWSADPARRDFLLAARNNVFQVPFWDREAAERFSGLDEQLDALLEKLAPGEFQLIVELWHVRDRHEWRDADSLWLDRLAEKLAARGLGYEDWYLQIYDETLSDEFLAAAQAVKRHNPAVRIFSDCLVRDPAVVAAFAGAVDLWCPLAGFLPPREEGFAGSLAAIRRTGLPVWNYTCDSTPAQTLSGYRLQSWQAWLLELDGTAYWTCKNASLRNRPGEPNLGMTYAGKNGEMLPSRRWNQWCAGLEDYLLLWLASRDATPDARRQLQALARSVLAGEITADAGRRQLLERLTGAVR